MNEKPNPPKKDIYSYLAVLLCFALFVAGVCGIVSSRTASHEYKNSDDVREVSAVVQDYEPIAIKDSDGNTTDWKYKAKLSFDVEGKTYTGKDTFYRDISSGDKVTVEVYRTGKGEYKLAPGRQSCGFPSVLYGCCCRRFSDCGDDTQRCGTGQKRRSRGKKR